MATCPNGHKNPDSQRFCGECGARIQTASERKTIATKAKAETESKLADFESGGISLAEFQTSLGETPALLPKTVKAAARSTPPSSLLSGWPPNAEPYYRPSLIAAIAATVGVMVGTIGPWVTALIITVTGLDAGNWGIAALTLGAVSCIALLIELFWPRTPFNPRWAVPLAWAAAVAGVACLVYAVPFLIRIMTIPKANFFGIPVGAGVGWGLWLLAFSSAVLCVAASIVATQIAEYVDVLRPLGQSGTSWTSGWRWAAIIVSAIIVLSGIAYFSTHWENDSGGSASSPTKLPSFPGFPSFPNSLTTSEIEVPATTTIATTAPTTAPTMSAGASPQPIDYSCNPAIQAAIAGAGHTADISPTPAGYTRVGLPMPGNNIAPVTVPTRCVEAFLADAHAAGLVSHGGDAQLMTDGLVACRTFNNGQNAYGQTVDRDAVAIQVYKAELALTHGHNLFNAKGVDITPTDLVDLAIARLCPI
jgi:hypothetical protein